MTAATMLRIASHVYDFAAYWLIAITAGAFLMSGLIERRDRHIHCALGLWAFVVGRLVLALVGR